MRSGSEPVRTAVVTGASGYLGRHLVAELERRGWSVTRCLRTQSAPRDGEDPQGAVLVPELDDASLSRVPMEVDTVFHLAGLAHRFPPHVPSDDEYERVNGLGSEAVARAARNRARRVVLASSVAAIGGDGTTTIHRGTAPTPKTAYGRSKLSGERLARAALDGSGTSLVVLRFPAIYGVDAPGAVTQLARWIELGRPIPSCARHARRSMIAVANAVDALIASSQCASLAGEVAIPHDRHTLDVLSVARAIGAGAGIPVRTVPCPAALLRLLGRLLGSLGVAAAASAERLLEHSVVEDDTLARLASWTPPVDATDALRTLLRRSTTERPTPARSAA